jgi:two-component system, sensor histidine kinase and response regulator
MSKILVIDDEPWMRELIRVAMELRKFEVIEAGDSVEGDAMARAHLPDLILCDINMDKAGAGFTTLAKLREDAATAAIPFILMTGMADTAGMRHGMELGADDYLPKPFTVDELYATVNARLHKAQTVRKNAEQKLTTLRTHISLMLPHEMRTPLNGIISNAEILATGAGTLDAKTITEIGQEISQSGQRLERLIENFLFYARLEIVATDAESIVALRSAQTTNAADVARAVAVAEAETAGRLTDLVLDLAETPLPMAEDYVKKIIAELARNAFKFSPAGKPVKVTLQSVGEQVVLSVSDRGRGFSSEHIRNIDAYVQFERKMQDEQGLGLGLAIAKKLADLHGGSLTIESRQGEGATVTIKLPAVKAA